MSKLSSPGTALSAASASAWIFPFSGHAGVVSSIFSVARAPWTRRSFTMPARTRSMFSSGSITLDRAASTSRSETLIVAPEEEGGVTGPFFYVKPQGVKPTFHNGAGRALQGCRSPNACSSECTSGPITSLDNGLAWRSVSAARQTSGSIRVAIVTR